MNEKVLKLFIIKDMQVKAPMAEYSYLSHGHINDDFFGIPIECRSRYCQYILTVGDNVSF
jgi:hypothetical protein